MLLGSNSRKLLKLLKYHTSLITFLALHTLDHYSIIAELMGKRKALQQENACSSVKVMKTKKRDS